MLFLMFTFAVFVNHTYFFLGRRYQVHLSDIAVLEKTLHRPPKSTMLHITGTMKHLGAAKQIYIINLSYRADRRTGSIALFQTLHLDAFIVPAYSVHSPEVISRTHLAQNGYMTLVEIACWASHMRVWLEIAASENNGSWALVFEDDIDLEMSASDILELFPRDLWNIPDLIYLGHCGDPPGPVLYEGIQGFRVHRSIYPSCTHAYAIRAHAASKLIRLLSSPRRAIDDEIVLLVDVGKILAYSIHPPLALQQMMTSSRQSDVNPVAYTLIFQTKVLFSSICKWWRGMDFESQLKHSTLAQADFRKAENWRKSHETEMWRIRNMNFSYYSYVK